MDISWVNKGRYIFFESLRKDEHPFPEIYQAASSRLDGISSRISPQTKELEAGKEEENFTEQIRAYMSMLETIYTRMANDEASFFKEAIDIIDTTPFLNIKNIINELGSGGRLSENDYMVLIAFTNAIQNSDSTNAKIKKNIETARNNIRQLKLNFNNLDSETQKKETQNYINHMGTYQKNLAGKLMKGAQADKEIILRHMRTTSEFYAERINSILKAISNSSEFQLLIAEEYRNHLNNDTFTLNGGKLQELILNLVTNQVINNTDQIFKRRSEAIAKDIVQQIKNHNYQLDDFKNEYSRVFSEKNNKKSVNKKSLEEIALSTDANLSQILESAMNSKEILEKYQKFCTGNELLQTWDDLQALLKDEQGSLNKIKQTRKSLNIKLRDAITKSLFGEETPFKVFKKKIEQNSSLLQDKLKTISQDNLSFTEDIIEHVLPNFSKGCKLTVSKSDISEILATQIADNLPSLIQGKIPGNKINMKDDVRFILDFGQKDIATLINSRMNKQEKNTTTLINTEIRKYINDTVGNFLEDYRQAGKGATNVAVAEETYINELKQMYEKIKNFLDKINADEQQRQEAFSMIKNIMVGAISVKDYTLYNDDLGYHGGSLGSGGAPDGVIENITKMYELGGITPEDKDNLMFAVLNCAPSAIGSNLKESLEQYLLGGAALIMFDEGFSFGSKYINDVKAQLNIDFAGPKTLTLYYLNQTYIPGSYILYNIYENLKAFYNKLPTEEQKVKKRNRVVITNNASVDNIVYSSNLQDAFSKTAAAAEKNIKIQFLFMAGMLDILDSLSEIFNQT